MSREIKFRVWIPSLKKFIYSDEFGYATPLIALEHFFNHIGIYDDENEFFQQYTGLKDKNDNEIYEGDILKRNDHYGIVKYSEKRARFIVLFDDEKIIPLSFSKKWNWSIDENQIIGNIYENQELLTEENKT